MVVFAALPLLVPATGRTAEPDDEVRQLVQRYFALYAAKDLDGFMALWSDQSPDYASRKQTMKRIFAETGDIKVKELAIVKVEVARESVRLRLRVELEGADKRSGKLHADLGKLNRLLFLERRQGAWKVSRYGPVEDELIVRLLAADGKDAREKLYRANQDLVGRGLVDAAHRLFGQEWQRGRTALAARTNEVAFEIAEKLSDRVALANCHLGRGAVAHGQGEYPAARTALQRALELFRQAKDPDGEAKALNNLGVLFRDTGRYSEALRSHQDSLEIARQQGDRRQEASALGNMGVVHRDVGRLEEALRCYQDCLKIQREVGDPETPIVLNNIALVYDDWGRYAEALRYLHDSLKIAREGGHRGSEGRALNNLGTLYRQMHLNTEALRCYQDSLKIKRERGDLLGQGYSLRGIGHVYSSLGQYDAALQVYQESLTIARRLGNRAEEAYALGNLGDLYKSLRRYDEALQYLLEGLAIKRELGNPAAEASALCNIAILFRQTGRYDEALEKAEAAIRLAQSTGAAVTVINCRWNSGDVYRDRQQWAKAEDCYRQAIDGIEDLRGGAREQSLQTSLLERYVLAYHHRARCLLELGRPADAFAVAEQAKARTLVGILQQGKADVRKGMSAEQRRQEDKWREHLEALTAELELLRGRKADPQRQEQLAELLKEARQDYEAFRRDLYLRLPELRVRRGEFRLASLTDLNRTLFAGHPGLVVLSYLVSNHETFLFVLRPGAEDGPARLDVHRLGVGYRALAEAVEEFRGVCQKPAAGVPDGTELYRLLLAPAEEALAGAGHVVIAPDAMLHTLPFHALRDRDPDDPHGRYLVQRCPISYAPSITALREMVQPRRVEASVRSELLVVGIGDFGRRERSLPAAESEARAVAGLFPGRADLLLGRDATKANLRKAWSGLRRLHFATHGWLNAAAPLYSAVVLSPADQRDEGLLFARDLLDEELTAELVVLSACETGLGEQVGGEGLLGLTWAWFVAGVPSTVATLWSVADDSTARLMQSFYQNLRDGTTKAEALRRGQLTLLEERQTRHPFYWAPFVLSGDPW